MPLLDIPTDVSVSLFNEWIDRFSFMALDSALTNRGARSKYLTILGLTECKSYPDLKNHNKMKFLKWIEARGAYFRCFEFVDEFTQFSELFKRTSKYFTILKLPEARMDLLPWCGQFEQLQELEFNEAVDLTDEYITTLIRNLPNKQKLLDVILIGAELITSDSLACIASNCINIKSLLIQDCLSMLEADENFNCPSFKRAESITLTNNDPSSAVLAVIFKDVKHLTFLYLDDDLYFDCIEPQENLKDLTVEYVSRDNELLKLICSARELTSLCLVKCTLKRESFTVLRHVCKNIKLLNLDHDNVKDVVELMSDMTQLTTFMLEGGSSYCDEVLTALHPSCSTLTTLNLQYSPLTLAGGVLCLDKVFEKSCNLRNLHFFEEFRVSWFEYLAHLQELTLDFANLEQIAEGVQMCPNLRMLDLGAGIGNADCLFQAIAIHGNNLRVLTFIAGARLKMTTDGLLTLCDQPSLREFTLGKFQANWYNLDMAYIKSTLHAANPRLFVEFT